MAQVLEKEEVSEAGYRLRMARLKYWLFVMFIKFPFLIVAIGIAAEGWRVLNPSLSQKVYRSVFFLNFMKGSEGLAKLDYAFVWSTVTVVAASWAIGMTVKLVDARERYLRENAEPNKLGIVTKLFVVIGLFCAVVDAYMFFEGLCVMSWGGGVSFPSLISTSMYLAVLILVSMISMVLGNEIDKWKEAEICERFSR